VKQIVATAALTFLLLSGGFCAGWQAIASRPIDTATHSPSYGVTEIRMWMTVGELRFVITLADTPAARAFGSLLPLTVDMIELNGNEKYAELPNALPTNASRPGTILTGDLMLYGERTLVIFLPGIRVFVLIYPPRPHP